MSAVKEGELLWTPSAQRVARANLTHYMAWLAERGRTLRFLHGAVAMVRR